MYVPPRPFDVEPGLGFPAIQDAWTGGFRFGVCMPDYPLGLELEVRLRVRE